MERLVIMTPGKTIDINQLPETMLEGSQIFSSQGEEGQPRESSSLREAREEFEREFIIRKLEENDWNVNLTAESIALERSNLQRKIKSYGIEMRK
jgi:two-component system nitrogen regulation response regulator NtrX